MYTVRRKIQFFYVKYPHTVDGQSSLMTKFLKIIFGIFATVRTYVVHDYTHVQAGWNSVRCKKNHAEFDNRLHQRAILRCLIVQCAGILSDTTICHFLIGRRDSFLISD